LNITQRVQNVNTGKVLYTQKTYALYRLNKLDFESYPYSMSVNASINHTRILVTQIYMYDLS